MAINYDFIRVGFYSLTNDVSTLATLELDSYASEHDIFNQ